jgi:hypothetical protein
MAQLSKTLRTVNLGTSNAAAPTILAASSTVTRYIRSLLVVNNGTATTWNFAIGTAAILTAANSIWFGKAIAAGETFTYYWGGKGSRLMVPATDVVMAFAGATNVTLEFDYDEIDLT